MGREREFGDYEDDDDRGDVVPQDGEYDRIRTRGRERFKYLARHKDPQVEWWTCVGPTQNWGTQETIWPLSKAARSAQATPRLGDLSTPKKNFQTGVHVGRPIWQYSCGRSSALDFVQPTAMSASASERVSQLAQHKTYSRHTPNRNEFLYSCGRVSPVWQVADHAQSCEPRPHTVDLAQHKQPHRDFQPHKDIPWPVTEAARSAKASERIDSLSMPKNRPDGPFRGPEWPVSESAMNSVASPRCVELSRAKSLADGFQHAREIQWPVTKAARRATSSGRLSELAQPIQRVNMNILQFNPDAFQVKTTALKGRLSSRVNELAQPINR
ncbi:testicular haploid expressed gene protein-like [Aplysia californica]|uniref:Testicular haploid expressed gene protein-like n=1 Tax=Aplysia californica TaxID=6500 RepID=A0ABM0JB56_APLCA|nr:testicular haploid expressed gene protein-like [Aplysia californica]